MTLMLGDIKLIYQKMAHSAMAAGREPNEVSLIAVSKMVPSKDIMKAFDIGLRNFGESKIQEAKEKISQEPLAVLNDGIKWHMIGHLQKNKAKTAVALFDLIHSIDSIELLEKINKHAGEIGKVQRVLIEVKLSNEFAKTGLDKELLKELIEKSRTLENVRVEGLMTIPPYFDNPEESRPYFKELKQLADKFGLHELSMGMSGDYEVAISEGSTMVRVGTAIFGDRCAMKSTGGMK